MTDFMDLFREELRTFLHSDEPTKSFSSNSMRDAEICEYSDKEDIK